MANQNLSQFGEKLFVADADHTFIWDTAASISKRVSRNSWLSGTTADFHLGLADAATPVAQTISVQSVIAGTTNTAGANLSINGSQGTGTGAGGSLLLRTAPAGSSGTAQNALVTAVAITSAGNVGIGTTAPGAKLDVVGNILVNGATQVIDSGNILSVKGDAVSASKAGYIVMTSGDNLVSSYQGAIAGNFSNPGAFFGTFTNHKCFIRTGNAERVTIDTVGNVGIGTTSPTSKLHVAGDAVLTGDLLGTNYTIGVPTILTQSNISITNNHSGVADSAIVITPKGTGGIIVGAKPDGTTTGGNVRGLYAVDLQINRSSNTAISSGDYSVICGGQGNTSSAINSFVGGGQRNVANASFSTIAGGLFGVADRYALFVHSAGRFAGSGDAQSSKAVFRNKTTTNSAVELFLDGVSARYVVGSGKIISMLINITGTKSDGSAVAHYVRQYSIKNIGGTTSEVYPAVLIGTDNTAGTSIALSADNTNDSLKIEVTGVASETWRWVASVDAVEVGHGT